MDEEEWKDIIGYENYYKISNKGNIKSLDRIITLKNGFTRKEPGKNMKIGLSHKNYYFVMLSKNSKNTYYEIHRLLAIHFLENINNYNIVNHIDGNSLNNNLNNLEWCNLRENTTHGNLNKNLSSNFPCVYKPKNSKKFLAEIKHNKKKVYLGSFNNEIDAYKKVLEYKNNNNIINKYLNE
jgi:hypothetical protein